MNYGFHTTASSTAYRAQGRLPFCSQRSNASFTAFSPVRQAQAPQLTAVIGDVLVGRDARVLPGFDRELLSGQSEGVEAHRRFVDADDARVRARAGGSGADLRARTSDPRAKGKDQAHGAQESHEGGLPHVEG
jgi:hypothetical protein